MQENPKTLTTLHCSGTKRLFTSWLLVFRHEARETHFLLCWLFLHRPQPTPSLTARPRIKISTHWPNKRAAHPVAPSWTALAQSQISTNVFFEITKFPSHRFRTWRHSHSGFISYLGVLLWHLWLSYPLRASVNCTNVCTCTCTKPNSSKPNQTEW